MESARTAPPRHPQPHQYQSSYASHPPTPISAVAPPPPPPAVHHIAPAAEQRPPSHYSQHPPHPPHHTQGPPPQPYPYLHSHEQRLPPIYNSAAHPQESAGLHTSGPIPSYRPATSQPEGNREQHSRSGNVTPAPINPRSYSHELAAHQRTPSTPGPYPSGPGPEAQAGTKSMEHGMQYGPPNGVHHAPPGYYNGPPHEAPVHYSAGPVQEHHTGHIHQPHMYQPTYGPSSYQSANTMNKRKPMRAQQACEQCRQRKQKCDEGNPCSFCKEQCIPCTYRDTPPAKVDKNSEKILEAIANFTKEMQGQRAAIDTISARIDRLDNQFQPQSNGAQAQPSDAAAEEYTSRITRQSDHRTGPHKLISLWPTMTTLFDEGSMPKHTYVTTAEDRGPIRIHGRGEGIDEQDGTHPIAAPSSPAGSDNASDNAPTPREGIWGRGFINNVNTGTLRPQSLAGGLKPDGSLDLDSQTIRSLWASYEKHMHCMHPFLDRKRTLHTIETFIKHYSPDAQNKPWVGFVQPPTSTGYHHTANAGNESDRPLKRQRQDPNRTSPGASGFVSPQGQQTSTSNAPEGTNKKPITNERSPINAVIFLILALGKICQYTDDLPGTVPDNAALKNTTIAQSLVGNLGFSGSSPSNHIIKQSPHSPVAVSMQQTPSDSGTHKTEVHTRSRRSSHDSGTDGPAKNVERIPGLAYYAKAAELLGDHGDGQQIVHAQMFLLAALYKGQLARVKESMAWLAKAGLVCQSLVDRHNLYRDVPGAGVLENKTNLLILLASWSCLQLESDILAELKLPSSGIQSLENVMLFPGAQATEDAYMEVETTIQKDNDIMTYYYSQIFLRTRLNGVHKELYGHELVKRRTIGEVYHSLLDYEQTLNGWYELLKEPLRFERNSKELPTEILDARLRAKYYGALYVSTRPYLDYAMHIMPGLEHGRSVEDCAVDTRGNRRDAADILIFKAIQQHMSREAVLEKVKTCIEAAFNSTVAFDGVPARLIVTNIHGTAHAQFGNMLVLAAAYNTESVRPYIEKTKLEKQMERTIRFLRRLKFISPTCHHDLLFLEKIQQKLFPVPEDMQAVFSSEREPVSATTSFSH